MLALFFVVVVFLSFNLIRNLRISSLNKFRSSKSKSLKRKFSRCFRHDKLILFIFCQGSDGPTAAFMVCGGRCLPEGVKTNYRKVPRKQLTEQQDVQQRTQGRLCVGPDQ